MEIIRKCRDCHKEALALEDLVLFASNKKQKYGRDNLCTECNALRRRKARVDDPAGKINSHLKHRYGITLDEYNKMFIEQKGCCKICNIHQINITRKLAVDHCHKTQEVRGLLCNNCNTALGLFKDNITTMANAINYLKENNE